RRPADGRAPPGGLAPRPARPLLFSPGMPARRLAMVLLLAVVSLSGARHASAAEAPPACPAWASALARARAQLARGDRAGAASSLRQAASSDEGEVASG